MSNYYLQSFEDLKDTYNEFLDIISSNKITNEDTIRYTINTIKDIDDDIIKILEKFESLLKVMYNNNNIQISNSEKDRIDFEKKWKKIEKKILPYAILYNTMLSMNT